MSKLQPVAVKSIFAKLSQFSLSGGDLDAPKIGTSEAIFDHKIIFEVRFENSF